MFSAVSRAIGGDEPRQCKNVRAGTSGKLRRRCAAARAQTVPWLKFRMREGYAYFDYIEYII
jgi:hypothetical protein